MNRKTFLIPLLTLLSTVFALASEWRDVTGPLVNSVPDMDNTIPGARWVGGVAVDRHTGDLLVGLQGPPFGIWRSPDGGDTWTRFDDGSVGGAWRRSSAMCLDQNQPGRMAFFRSGPPAPQKDNGRGGTVERSQSAMTLDNGETWTPFDEARGLFGQDGWSHGAVDWAAPTPLTFLAQNRVRPSLALSINGGEDFDKPLGKGLAMIHPNDHHAYARAENTSWWQDWKEDTLAGYGVCKEAILLGRFEGGIDRSEDGGENFERVSEERVTAPSPVYFEGKLFWGGEKGLLVSTDDGGTWFMPGAPLPNIRKGPYFGATALDMVVVTEDGIYRSTDGSQNWEKVSDLPHTPGSWRADVEPRWLRQSYAWDHRRNRLYVAGLASPLYALDLSEAPTE